MTRSPGAADDDFVVPQPQYEQSLPVFDRDDDTGAPPTIQPDGSEWEPAATSETWEDNLVADPEAAAAATQQRMREQFEQDLTHEDPSPADG